MQECGAVSVSLRTATPADSHAWQCCHFCCRGRWIISVVQLVTRSFLLWCFTWSVSEPADQMCRRVMRSKEEISLQLKPCSSGGYSGLKHQVNTLKEVWISDCLSVSKRGSKCCTELDFIKPYFFFIFLFCYAEERHFTPHLHSFKRLFPFCCSVSVCVHTKTRGNDKTEC